MSTSTSFEIHQLQVTIRFIQGYRYLDRCGEALIKLEKVLAEGWIPTDPTPRGGTLRNDLLGMTATFNSEAVTVQQVEFISPEQFRDQGCKIYDTLWQVFSVERIHAPTMRVVLQKGFTEDQLDAASRYVLSLNLCSVNPEVLPLLEGELSALDFAMVTTQDLIWRDQPVQRRRRMAASVVRQEKQPPFDVRLLQRTRLLPERQRDAMAALLRLKRQHPETAPVAAQVDVETSLETEFSAEHFDLPGFLAECQQWAENLRQALPRFEKKQQP